MSEFGNNGHARACRGHPPPHPNPPPRAGEGAEGAFDFAELRRWAASGAIVVLAHGGVAAAMVSWREPIDLSEPAAAIVIQFAPVPVAPAALATEVPPGPEQVESDASPSKPGEIVEEKIEERLEQKTEAKLELELHLESKPVEEPPPPLPPAPDPELAIAPPPPRQEAKLANPQLQEPRTPAPLTLAPQALPVETAAVPAAPEQGPFTPSDAKALQSWQKQIVALLERNKRYPPAAQARRQQGVAQVFFSLDRQGRVVESRITRSSGAALLDEEAMALIRRAQPFPPWPARELRGEKVELTVPIRFNLK
jgi:periplasmic protein TonB